MFMHTSIEQARVEAGQGFSISPVALVPRYMVSSGSA